MLTFTTPSGKTGDPSVLYQAQPAYGRYERLANLCHNLARKLPRMTPSQMERGSDVMKLACYGPSLLKHWEKVGQGEGDIWTISGANSFLWARGIKARYHLEADPRPHKAKLLAAHCPETTFLIASRCAPEVFDALKDDRVLVYHMHTPDEKFLVDELCPNEYQVAPAWTMGNTALWIGLLGGYKKFIIYAMDGSFDEEGRQHPTAHPNDAPAAQEFVVEKDTPLERKFMSSPNHVVAAECFVKIAQNFPYGTFEFVGDGMIPYMWHCYTKDYHEVIKQE